MHKSLVQVVVMPREFSRGIISFNLVGSQEWINLLGKVSLDFIES